LSDSFLDQASAFPREGDAKIEVHSCIPCCLSGVVCCISIDLLCATIVSLGLLPGRREHQNRWLYDRAEKWPFHRAVLSTTIGMSSADLTVQTYHRASLMQTA